MEDLAGAAFAGQHDTFLQVVGTEDVIGRVRECFISLWSDRAVAYREKQGFDHADATMAVVVQEMVASESAGVGFSVNPVSGRLGEIVINSSFGLGESVVSGDGEIDQWIIDKKSGVIRDAIIGRKSSRIVGGERGTREEMLEDGLRPSLTEEQLTGVADLLAAVEESYGYPQDIEWAFSKNVLWLLQSRPITTIPPVWTREESAERFPNAITPLTWDFVESGFHRSLGHSFRLLGFPPFPGKWFAMYDHYIYGNQNAVELYARRAPFSVKSIDELRMMIPRLRKDFAWVQELPVSWMRDLDHYLVTLGRFQGEALDGKSDLGIWRHVLAVNEHGAKYFLPNIAISIAHGMLHRILHGLLRLVIGPEESDLIFHDLMDWCETKTGQINKELFGLAELAKERSGWMDAWGERDSRELIEEGVLAEHREFQERFERFLRDHGHREVDFDAYVATWEEAPWIVLDSVRLILRTPMDVTPSEKQRALKIRAQEAEMRMISILPPDLHFFFHELARLARVYTGLDDLEHYQTTRLTPALRRGLGALGKRLTGRGILEEPMDVFFARQEQIELALTSDESRGWKDFSECVKRQKAAYLVDKDRQPEWQPHGNPNEVSENGEVLMGLAGSPGVAEGPVFMVTVPDDFAKFPKGAVLVARTTNPAWTPLFYSAVAVITESGGPLSHGAVTAREMGIPAVMCVRESMSRLKNGEKVRVNGQLGTVEILG